uniref:Uncharacterized protein n=1 Tax=Cyanoderma ruficeps TaxID=181631 RepID=A0A8C3NPU9_9PASS
MNHKSASKPEFRGGPRRPAARSRPFSPFAGQLSVEDTASMVLCKPKILPLKSVSLEKLEKLQRAAISEHLKSRHEAEKQRRGSTVFLLASLP